jgi:hypothetical protein
MIIALPVIFMFVLFTCLFCTGLAGVIHTATEEVVRQRRQPEYIPPSHYYPHKLRRR